MENEEQLTKTKTLVELHEELTSSIPMGGQLGQSQDNGSRVLADGKIDAFVNGTGGGGGVGSDGDVPSKELAKKRNLREGEEDNSGERVSVERTVEGDRVTEKVECGGQEVKEIVSSGSNGGMSLKSLAKSGRRPKIESGGQSMSDGLGSVSQRTRKRVVTGRNEEDKSVGVVEKGIERGDGGDQEHGFSVGDFVWGKIKSHPWWPGRIYDPLDASEFALKYKHEGRLLVAYFEDGTFAWCDPSQLQPFLENFDEMSKQSCSKNFRNAVGEAVKEFGRLVRQQTMCSCARKGSQSSLPKLVVNAGVREGVVVPDCGAQMFSISQFEPVAMLAALRHYATFDSVGNFLQITALESQLSAFYGAKGRFLPEYYDPLGIEGLMDKGELPRESTVQGPEDGDCFIGPGTRAVSQSGPETPLDRSHTRKQKSITELLGNTDVPGKRKNFIETEGGKLYGKQVLKSGRTKKDFPSEDHTGTLESNGDRSSKTKDEGPPKTAPKSGSKRRNISDEDRGHVSNNMMVTRSSSRKKDGSARPTSIKNKDFVPKDDDNVVKDKQKAESVSQGRKLNVSLSSDSNLIASERISPREKKKSRYLSPPYTIQPQQQRFSVLQIRSGAGLELSDVAKMGERMSKAASKLVGSPSLVKSSAESSQKSSKVAGSKHGKTGTLDSETKQRNLSLKACGSTGNIDSLSYVLQEIESAALNPLRPRKSQSLIREFMFSYRSWSYENGSNYNVDKKDIAAQRKRKINSSDTMNKKKVKSAETEKGKSSAKSPTMIPDNQPLAVLFIREKLDLMKSLLPHTDGNMSEEIQSRLKNEAKALLKNLKLMKTSS